MEHSARDDGSTDTTIALLDQWASRIPLVVTRGTHIGATASFFELLCHSRERDNENEIVAFADQDDVWDGDKLTRAVRALRELPPERPALYCSRAGIVDENLRPLGLTRDFRRPPSFENALVENIAMGCTMALNQAAVRLLTSVPPPARARMHDWWCYLVTRGRRRFWGARAQRSCSLSRPSTFGGRAAPPSSRRSRRTGSSERARWGSGAGARAIRRGVSP